MGSLQDEGAERATFSIPAHHLCLDPGAEWVPEAIQSGTEHLGAYLRSTEFGVYMNVREQDRGPHPLTKDGLISLLREQNWGPSIDEWHSAPGNLIIVGGSFETTGMGGEIVLEVFVTDGRRVANLAGPGPRELIAKLRPAVERLAATLRLE